MHAEIKVSIDVESMPPNLVAAVAAAKLWPEVTFRNVAARPVMSTYTCGHVSFLLSVGGCL